jgi:hypothetical protein
MALPKVQVLLPARRVLHGLVENQVLLRVRVVIRVQAVVQVAGQEGDNWE